MRSAVTTSNVTDIAKRATEAPPPSSLRPPPPHASAASRPPMAVMGGGIPKRSPSSGLGAANTNNGGAGAIPKRSPSTGGRGGGAATSSSNSNPNSIHQAKLSTKQLDPNRFANPFDTNTSKCKSTFSSSYMNGSIPCRLHTSASRYHLQWEKGAETGFSPDLLVVCADGLIETEHPYVVMAPLMFQELCVRSEGCLDLFSPQVIETIAGHIRTALMASGGPQTSSAIRHATSGGGAGCGTGTSIFEGALKALTVFLQHTGNLMLPYLAKYIIPVLARPFSDKAKKEPVAEVLRLIEQQCGPEATKIIKAKIPTW